MILFVLELSWEKLLLRKSMLLLFFSDLDKAYDTTCKHVISQDLYMNLSSEVDCHASSAISFVVVYSSKNRFFTLRVPCVGEWVPQGSILFHPF